MHFFTVSFSQHKMYCFSKHYLVFTTKFWILAFNDSFGTNRVQMFFHLKKYWSLLKLWVSLYLSFFYVLTKLASSCTLMKTVYSIPLHVTLFVTCFRSVWFFFLTFKHTSLCFHLAWHWYFNWKPKCACL